jgi:hypothetical protein
MRRPGVLAAALLVAVAATFLASLPALALSEIRREELPAPTTTPTTPETENPEKSVPLPDPITPSTEIPEITGPEGPADLTQPEEQVDPNAPLPEVIYDLSRLPPEVRRMRDLIVEAAKTGDIEKLRPLLGVGDDLTQLSLGDDDSDPIDFLKTLSGDPDGQEILAIMEEVLSAGYVHLDAGTPEELYVWPYFFGIPLDRLTAPQRVELFKIVTAGDYEDMKNFGSYIFYRVGITPQGRWAFFVAGE